MLQRLVHEIDEVAHELVLPASSALVLSGMSRWRETLQAGFHGQNDRERLTVVEQVLLVVLVVIGVLVVILGAKMQPQSRERRPDEDAEVAWAVWQGLAAQKQGNKTEAHKYFVWALNETHRLQRRFPDLSLSVDPRLGATFDRLGDLHGADGAYSLVARAIERAIENERTLGQPDPGTADALAFLASLYRGIGGKIFGTAGGEWSAMAFQLDQRVLHIREEAVAHDDLGVAEALDIIAGKYYHDKGSPERFAARAQTIREKRLGPDDPRVILGRLRLGAGEAGARQALAAMERVVGPHDPRYAYLLERLANVLLSTGRHAEAESTLARVLEIRERTQGVWHPLVAETLMEFAGVCAESRTADAERMYLRAIEILRRAAGLTDPVTVGSQEIFEFRLPEDDSAGGRVTVLERISVTEDRCWLLRLPTRAEQPGAPPGPLVREASSPSAVLERPALSASHPEGTTLARLATALESYAAHLHGTGREDDAGRLEAEADALHYGLVKKSRDTA